MNIEELFYDVDDFHIEFDQHQASQQLKKQRQAPGPKAKLCPSEVMAIIIYFQMSGYGTIKQYYLKHVCRYWRSEFPNLGSVDI